MRTLILGDIHSNLIALQAVLADAEERGGFDQVWCLGDTVGYGPDPRPCLELLRRYPLLAVAGNHDQAATGQQGVEEFNGPAAEAARWTALQLTEEDRDFLSGLPLTATSGDFTLVHGSLREPLWEYLLNEESALATFKLLSTRYCLVSHSHISFICREKQGEPAFLEFTEDQKFVLNEERPNEERPNEERWIINPGSVGQPRDQDPRPSYAIYDSGQGGVISRHRVSYDIGETQERMRQARLPQRLIERLNYGV